MMKVSFLLIFWSFGHLASKIATFQVPEGEKLKGIDLFMKYRGITGPSCYRPNDHFAFNESVYDCCRRGEEILWQID